MKIPRITGLAEITNKFYRKLRYRKGFGVHSPFVYDLITKVIEEKMPYYAFDKIKRIRKIIYSQIHISGAAKIRKIQNHNYGTLLFRLVNFFRCKIVFQVGSPAGIMCLYTAAANSELECIVLEESEESCTLTRMMAEKAGFNNITVRQGSYLTGMQAVFEEKKKIDLFFINIAGHDLCAGVTVECLLNAGEEAILIIDGIHKGKSMNKIWKDTIACEQVSVSLDLYALGIVFLNKRTHKQHHKVYFNNGKEQTLYKNRRQRFDIFSRRKKSF